MEGYKFLKNFLDVTKNIEENKDKERIHEL